MIGSSDGDHYDWPKAWPDRRVAGETAMFFSVSEGVDCDGKVSGGWLVADSFDAAADLAIDAAAEMQDRRQRYWITLVTMVMHGGMRICTEVAANNGFRWRGKGGSVDPMSLHRSIAQCASHALRQMQAARQGTADVSAESNADDDDEDTQLAPDDRFDAEKDANGPAQIITPPEERPSSVTESSGPSS